MKQIPFDLERALAGDPVITRAGTKVARIHVVPDWCKFVQPILFSLEGSSIRHNCSLNGRYYQEADSPYDLFMAPRTVTKWMIIYRHHAIQLGFIYESEERALREILPSINYYGLTFDYQNVQEISLEE